MKDGTKTTTGVILAGGASTRFGSNKALAIWQGKPLISHIASTLEKTFPDHLLVTNQPDTYAFLNWKIIGDIYPKSGPLAGIHAALNTIDHEQACIVGCDMPLLDSEFLSFLCNLPGKWDAALPWLDNGPEPLCGIYRKSCLPVIEKQLKLRQRKVRLTLEKLRIRKVSREEVLAHAPNLTTFHNINRLEDLRLLPQKTIKENSALRQRQQPQ